MDVIDESAFAGLEVSMLWVVIGLIGERERKDRDPKLVLIYRRIEACVICMCVIYVTFGTRGRKQDD